jgi:hypothetical protein
LHSAFVHFINGFQGEYAMNFRSFRSIFAALAACAVLAFTGAASAQSTANTCVGDCGPAFNATQPNLTSGIGVVVFGNLQSHTAGQGVGQGVGGNTTVQTFAIGEELFQSGGQVNYKVDPNCGPVCGQQTATATFDGLQKVGSGALTNTTASGTGNVVAGSNSNTGNVSGFKYFGGVNWGKTPTTGVGGGSN